MAERLRFFISSTADLRAERDAVEAELASLEIDGSRFEAWSSSPSEPLDECLYQVERSDGLILIMGQRYGSLCAQGISVTHAEFRKAVELKKEVFAFMLDVEFEEAQESFRSEVETQVFRCRLVRSVEELKKQVRASVTDALTRAFRKATEPLPILAPVSERESTRDTTVPILPDDRIDAFHLLRKLYHERQEQTILSLAAACELRFSQYPDLMNYIHMSAVNLGIRVGLCVVG